MQDLSLHIYAAINAPNGPARRRGEVPHGAPKRGRAQGKARPRAPLSVVIVPPVSVNPQSIRHTSTTSEMLFLWPLLKICVFYRSVSLLTLAMPDPVFPALRSRSAFFPRTFPSYFGTNQGCRFVEETYKLEIGNAQTSQLSKAITSGVEKNIFVLPKGMFPS